MMFLICLKVQIDYKGKKSVPFSFIVYVKLKSTWKESLHLSWRQGSLNNIFSCIFELPSWWSGQKSSSNAGDTGSTPGSARSSEEGNDNQLPGKPHEQRSLTGYSPWGRRELDMTEHTHTHTHNI